MCLIALLPQWSNISLQTTNNIRSLYIYINNILSKQGKEFDLNAL